MLEKKKTEKTQAEIIVIDSSRDETPVKVYRKGRGSGEGKGRERKGERYGKRERGEKGLE